MRIIIISILALTLSGCAGGDSYQQYIQAHQAGQAAYYEAAAKPLIDISLPVPNGQEYHIVVNREVRPLAPDQERPSEWAPVASQAIGAAGVIGGIYAGAELVGAVTGAAGTTITNSGDLDYTTVSGSGSPVIGDTAVTEVAPEPEAVVEEVLE